MPAYKYTKGNKTAWYANFYYTDWTGKKRHICKRGFATKREALQYEVDYKDKGKQSADITFSNLVDNYLKDMDARLKPTTMDGKNYILEHKILPYFKDLKVADITPVSIRNWQTELLNYRDEDGNGYAQTYLKSIHEQMSAIMNYACKAYGLLRNPCRTAGSIGKSKASEMSFWTKDEYDQFIATVDNPAMHLAFNILYYTGMRSGEMMALTPADILDSMEIRVNKNFATVKGEQLILTPKTDKGTRNVSIPQFLYDEIKEYIRGMYKIGPDERIFYFSKGGIEHYFRRTADKTDLPYIRLHDLRHSHASLLIKMNVPIKEIADRLGHESVKTTLDIYGHLYPDSAQKTAQRLHALNTTGADPFEDNEPGTLSQGHANLV